MRVVFECADWLVVEKPAHLLIHPTRPDGTHTLWHELLEAYPGETLSLMNRLDRETSGLVLVSRHRQAASLFGKMTMRREIQKDYLALVEGEAPEEGAIDVPLDRLGKYRQESPIYLKQGVVPEGYPAQTYFKRLGVRMYSTVKKISLLEVRLGTGRLHQIRVHLAHIGHPVIGDKIYGPDEMCYLRFIETGWTSELEEILCLSRHALHAYSLKFAWEGRDHEITIPLPEDLKNFWENLQKVAS